MHSHCDRFGHEYCFAESETCDRASHRPRVSIIDAEFAHSLQAIALWTQKLRVWSRVRIETIRNEPVFRWTSACNCVLRRNTTMKHTMMITILATIALAGCAKKAPGTNPTDMTAAAHRNECSDHRQNAAAADQRAQEASRSKYPKARYPAQDEAKRENEIADQHAEAAKKAEPTVVAEGGTPTDDPSCD